MSSLIISTHAAPTVWSAAIGGLIAAGAAYLRLGGTITIKVGFVTITIRGRRRPKT